MFRERSVFDLPFNSSCSHAKFVRKFSLRDEALRYFGGFATFVSVNTNSKKDKMELSYCHMVNVNAIVSLKTNEYVLRVFDKLKLLF